MIILSTGILNQWAVTAVYTTGKWKAEQDTWNISNAQQCTQWKLKGQYNSVPMNLLTFLVHLKDNKLSYHSYHWTSTESCPLVKQVLVYPQLLLIMFTQLHRTSPKYLPFIKCALYNSEICLRSHTLYWYEEAKNSPCCTDSPYNLPWYTYKFTKHFVSRAALTNGKIYKTGCRVLLLTHTWEYSYSYNLWRYAPAGSSSSSM